MYPVHESDSGSFQELARHRDLKFGQLSYLVIKPGFSRGNHYHKRKEEWFCCVHGKCRMDLFDINSNKTRELLLDSTKMKFVKVEPYEVHTLTNTSDSENCDLIIVISEEYIETDPDTFVK